MPCSPPFAGMASLQLCCGLLWLYLLALSIREVYQAHPVRQECWAYPEAERFLLSHQLPESSAWTRRPASPVSSNDFFAPVVIMPMVVAAHSCARLSCA